MKIGPESGEHPPVTHCVAISRDADTRRAIAAWAAGRQWQCQVESNPYLAWTKLLLIEKSKAERSRWGLQPHGRTVMLVDDRACGADALDQLSVAFDRYAPAAARITLHEGALPQFANDEPAWAAQVPATPSRDESDEPSTGHNPDESDEDNGRLTAEEIRMLLGDDVMEPVP